MRRALSSPAARPQPSVCILCRLWPSASTKRAISNSSPKLRVTTKSRLPSKLAAVGLPPEFAHSRFPPNFLSKHGPVIGKPKEERPWSIALLKERLGAVFKNSADSKNHSIVWSTEASRMRQEDPKRFKQLFSEYVESIRLAVGFQGEPTPDTPPDVVEAIKNVANFQRMYESSGQTALDVLLMDTFIMKKYDASHCVSAQRSLADFCHPAEWFPKTRTMKRTWHLHIGPTNSGKTYNALKRLEESKDGIFCGPLRLLAHEVYSRMNAKGIPCNLITGEERKIHPSEDVKLFSATVEMAAVEKHFEVAVIDEIQMISDPERGWAWAHAVLGIMAKEIHLCGELRAEKIVRKLADLCGEELIIHRYERLGQLEVMNESLNGDFSKIEKGDCIVGFSRKDIHTLKRFVEQITGLRCAIVYGALPAETRALQAQYFNDPGNDYDVLVASDAVGLGLNLSIKRVIFSTMVKYNGETNVLIPIPLTRQIAGRAGRYRSAADDKKAKDTFPTQASPENVTTLGPPADGKTGYVTTFVARDLELLKKNMATEPPQIEQAVIMPRNSVLEAYCALFPSDTPFHQILERIASQADVSDLFTFTNIKPMIEVASLLQGIEGLTDMEKIVLSLAPVKLNMDSSTNAFVAFAKAIALGKQCTLLDFPQAIVDINILDVTEEKPQSRIKPLEELHTVIMLYAWVSQRFRHTLIGDEITIQLKNLVEEKIDQSMRSEDASSILLRGKFRQDAKRGKMIDVNSLRKGMNVQQHPTIAAPPRMRPSNRTAAAAA